MRYVAIGLLVIHCRLALSSLAGSLYGSSRIM
jgi:hypothetical protein